MQTSILVPIYNEEKRMFPFVEDLITSLKKSSKKELIFINDGSTDKTLEKLQELAKKNPWIKIISYTQNQGKGYAVKKGVLESQGEQIIFIDADGSIQPDQIPIMLKHLKKYDVVVGDRHHKLSKVTQSKIREIIGKTFNNYVGFIFKSNIKDNLCGFKGFQRDAAQDLFRELLSNRWIFDVELFYRIKKKKYSLYCMPLVWRHKIDSKISPIDPLIMVYEIFKLRCLFRK